MKRHFYLVALASAVLNSVSQTIGRDSKLNPESLFFSSVCSSPFCNEINKLTRSRFIQIWWDLFPSIWSFCIISIQNIELGITRKTTLFRSIVVQVYVPSASALVHIAVFGTSNHGPVSFAWAISSCIFNHSGLNLTNWTLWAIFFIANENIPFWSCALVAIFCNFRVAIRH